MRKLTGATQGKGHASTVMIKTKTAHRDQLHVEIFAIYAGGFSVEFIGFSRGVSRKPFGQNVEMSCAIFANSEACGPLVLR